METGKDPKSGDRTSCWAWLLPAPWDAYLLCRHDRGHCHGSLCRQVDPIASPLICDPLFTARFVGNTFLQKRKEFLKRAEFQFATSIDFLDMALELTLQRG
jgi:hypothetical protein